MCPVETRQLHRRPDVSRTEEPHPSGAGDWHHAGVTTGLLLAAGAGTRMGRPKALIRTPAGVSWLEHALEALQEGGCDDVIVVLGAEAAQAALLVPEGVTVATAQDWETGQSASLRAGLNAVRQSSDSVLVHLVDLPDVGAPVVRRVLARAGDEPRRALARATFDGRPGHPVLLGADHWAPLLADLHGDRGARDYLARHRTLAVECGDLASGVDVDVPMIDVSAPGTSAPVDHPGGGGSHA